MGLDLSKLKCRPRCSTSGKTIAQCPACWEDGYDRKGEHLVIYDDGRFGCVLYPGEGGKEHRKRIWELAGEPEEDKPVRLTIRVKDSTPHA